jgi:Ferritin-like domain
VRTLRVTDAYPARGRFTRGRLLRTALGGGAAAAGGAALGRWSNGASLAAPSQADDEKILRLFLTLERAQEAFYRAALRSGKLHGDLHDYATTVAGQEARHVAFLTERVSGGALPQVRTDFGTAFASPARFRTAAIELEEATIAAYIGQGANLRRETLKAVATLVSVEARQVAWIRDLAGTTPAPRAADPSRAPQAVLADLRAKGLL